MNKQTIFEGAANKFYSFSAVIEWSFSNFGKINWSRKNGLLGIKSSASEPIGREEDCKEIH
jgi:hypothetical protein